MFSPKRLVLRGKSYIGDAWYILRHVPRQVIRKLFLRLRTIWLWIRMTRVSPPFAVHEVVLYGMDKYSIADLRYEVVEGSIHWFADIRSLNGARQLLIDVSTEDLLLSEHNVIDELDPLAPVREKMSRSLVRRLITTTARFARRSQEEEEDM